MMHVMCVPQVKYGHSSHYKECDDIDIVHVTYTPHVQPPQQWQHVLYQGTPNVYLPKKFLIFQMWYETHPLARKCNFTSLYTLRLPRSVVAEVIMIFMNYPHHIIHILWIGVPTGDAYKLLLIKLLCIVYLHFQFLSNLRTTNQK